MLGVTREEEDNSIDAYRRPTHNRGPGSDAQPQHSVSSVVNSSRTGERKLESTSDPVRPNQDPSMNSTQRPCKQQHYFSPKEENLPAEKFHGLPYQDQDIIVVNLQSPITLEESAAFDTKELPQSEVSNSTLEKPDETIHDEITVLDCVARNALTANQKTPAPRDDSSESDLDEDYIRCICGAKEDDQFLAMICCDGCTAWQHNVCMGLSEIEEELPQKYYCELCEPRSHRETLRALKRRERIWIMRLEKTWEWQVVGNFRNKIQA